MPGVLPTFLKELDQANKALGKNRSPQLNSSSQRETLRNLIERYFVEIRPTVIGASEVDQDVGDIDKDMQELLILCHKRGNVNLYKQLLTKIRKALIIIDARVVASNNAETDTRTENQIDSMIVDTLSKLAPSAASSYKQALLDLSSEHRHSWRGPATDLRESLRETLDYLASDDDVKKYPGYKQKPNTNGPTMKQKVRYILKNRGVSKAHSDPTEMAIDCIENAVGSFIRSVYTRSSVSTHTPTNRNEVTRIRDFVRVSLCELLEINA